MGRNHQLAVCNRGLYPVAHPLRLEACPLEKDVSRRACQFFGGYKGDAFSSSILEMPVAKGGLAWNPLEQKA